MPTQTYTVASEQPIQIYPAGLQASLLIRNNDSTNHVFLATVASGTGFDLGPGSAIVWSPGNALYASVTLGKPVTVTLLDNGGDLFDASAIAAQISISGAPPVDAPVTLVSSTSNVGNFSSGSLNVQSYQSVKIVIQESDTAASATPVYFQVDVDFNSVSIQTRRSYVFAAGSNSGSIELFVPCEGSTMTFAVKPMTGTPVGAGHQYTYSAVASYRPVTKPRVFLNSGWWGTSTATINTDSFGRDRYASLDLAPKAAGVLLMEYPPTFNGTLTYTIRVSGCSVAGRGSILDGQNGLGFMADFAIAVAAGVQIFTGTINTAYRPIRFSVDAAVVAGRIDAVFTYSE